MILSASRRTDLPAFYSEWLSNRLKEEYVMVRNPMNIHQVGKISLSPDVVDGIVFWSKNPLPMLDHLADIEKYTYYFQITLTAYDRDVEENVPSKNSVIIPGIQKLSKAIGKDRVIWRYDPIFFNDRYTMDHHCKCFRVLASKLGNYTEKCTVSFLDMYKNTERNVSSLRIQPSTYERQYEILSRFSEIASENGIYIDTCAEKMNFDKIKVCHACCIDRERFERIGNYKLNIGKDNSQRSECGCVSSIDIGSYNTCEHGCLYCYANYSQNTVKKNAMAHNPKSPLLYGEIGDDDVIKERDIKSCIENQMTLFDYQRTQERPVIKDASHNPA